MDCCSQFERINSSRSSRRIAGYTVPLGRPVISITLNPYPWPAWMACRIIAAVCESLVSAATQQLYLCSKLLDKHDSSLLHRCHAGGSRRLKAQAHTPRLG